MDVGGTIPGMESVELSPERKQRATHDHKDVGGRVAPGAVTEEAKADDCMDAGGTIPGMESVELSPERKPRATQEAKAEAQPTRQSMGK